ncbi:Hypothetical protein CINCED_3A003595 [Cinara cedri]|uniref:FAM193 C-terminal domain-containing protein n=2 Tax=Cinara cedri TaxID=506608 RepID=A0A5E4MSF9_9HEMI|nr:Hypothetical protein CINCED_3A003595 [Cinara cedri]
MYRIFKFSSRSRHCDSYHVFQNVENLVMEFVSEARTRQAKILESKSKNTPEMPQVFVFCLLESYRRLMAATDHLKNVIKPIEEFHLSKFNLSWRMMNQYLYHSRLYADRTVYHLVTTFIEQVLSKSALSQSLIRDYTKFVKEVKLNISEWAEARSCIHNIKCNEVWAMTAKKCKEPIFKDEHDLYPPSPLSTDDLIIDLTIPTPPQSPAPEYQEREENDDCITVDDDTSSNYCDCMSDSVTGDSQQNCSEDFDHYEKCLQESAELNSIAFSYSNMKEKMLCFYNAKILSEEKKQQPSFIVGTVVKNLGKMNACPDVVLVKETKPVNVKCPPAIDKDVTCKVDVEQLPKRRHPYPNVSKPSEPAPKPSNRPLHGHSCHKHTEHVKRMHHHDEISECSSGRSSQDDSCSERSTSSPRQCDCCYCEVFGHGLPSMAPVSRNYQEMRDRLRNLYLLKKAKQNVHPTNDTVKQKQKETNVHKPQPVHPTNQASQPSDKSGALKGATKKKKEDPILTDIVNGNVKLKNDDAPLCNKPIDELVNFIEGNKATNEKRAAKKARRREKKEELERIKKEEEAERKRIEEEHKKQEMERLKREEALKKEKKKGKNQSKQQKQNQQPKQTTNGKTQQLSKQHIQQSTQSSKKKNKQLQGNSKETKLTKKNDKSKKDNVEHEKMVTINRDSDSSKVTITFRGAVEDDVLCTLYDNEAIKAIQRLCDKNKQSQDQIEEKPNKKKRNRKKKQTEQLETQLNPKPVESVLITNKNAPKLPTNMKWYCSPDVNITPVPKTTNTIQPQPNTVLIKRTTTTNNNNNKVFARPMPPPSQPLPLTSPTAIQINEAVNKISSSSAPIDIDKLQLPPGITITKLDPSDYKPPRDIQQSTEKPKPTLQFPFSSSAAVAPFSMQQNAQNNVVVVKTDGYDETAEWSGAESKRSRRRKKINGTNIDDTNSENIQPGFTITKNLSTRSPCNDEGKNIAGQISTNTPRTMPLPVIIQRHGGIVTIRNPLYQRNDDAILTETNDSRVDGGDDDDANPSGKRRRRRRRAKGGSKQTDVEESVFEPKDIDLEDGEMDDDERELEAFKRFCLQSVPPQRKEKVHLNIKDIVLKKKSTAAAAAAAVGCV